MSRLVLTNAQTFRTIFGVPGFQGDLTWRQVNKVSIMFPASRFCSSIGDQAFSRGLRWDGKRTAHGAKYKSGASAVFWHQVRPPRYYVRTPW